jgi:hypothetical protein
MSNIFGVKTIRENVKVTNSNITRVYKITLSGLTQFPEESTLEEDLPPGLTPEQKSQLLISIGEINAYRKQINSIFESEYSVAVTETETGGFPSENEVSPVKGGGGSSEIPMTAIFTAFPNQFNSLTEPEKIPENLTFGITIGTNGQKATVFVLSLARETFINNTQLVIGMDSASIGFSP